MRAGTGEEERREGRVLLELDESKAVFRPQPLPTISSRSPSLRVCGAVPIFFGNQRGTTYCTAKYTTITSRLEEKRHSFLKDTSFVTTKRFDWFIKATCYYFIYHRSRDIRNHTPHMERRCEDATADHGRISCDPISSKTLGISRFMRGFTNISVYKGFIGHQWPSARKNTRKSQTR
jgi:hypothetical protein